MVECRKYQSGDISFFKIYEVDGIRYEIEVFMGTNDCENTGEAFNWPYDLDAMKITIKNTPLFISDFSFVTHCLKIEGNKIIGEGEYEDGFTFVDEENEIIPKIQFLLDPISHVKDEWKLKEGCKKE